jgi:hypothetical protein
MLKGEEKDVEVTFKPEHADQVSFYTTITVKVHLPNMESAVITPKVYLSMPIGDFIKPIEQAASSGFLAFHDGAALNHKKTFAEYDLINGAKVLLYPSPGGAAQKTPRWFLRFPRSNSTWYVARN